MLAEMNRKTYAKYAEMRAVGQETAAAMQHLSRRYADLEPYLRYVPTLAASPSCTASTARLTVLICTSLYRTRLSWCVLQESIFLKFW